MILTLVLLSIGALLFLVIAYNVIQQYKQKAEADIAQERKKAVNEVKDEIGGIAMEIASKVVEREISEKDHKDLIDEFIKNVGEAS